jgi:hypothetical protein
LDFLTANSVENTAHVMERRFDAVLTDSEKLFRGCLEDFSSKLPDSAKESAAYEKFVNFLKELGATKSTFYPIYS